VEAFGGSHGIRGDRGGLEAAVMRLRSGYYPDVIAEAAALWESLSQNHPFIAGNKRTAIASKAAHLGINGFGLQADELKTYRFLMDLHGSGRFQMSELEVDATDERLAGVSEGSGVKAITALHRRGHRIEKDAKLMLRRQHARRY